MTMSLTAKHLILIIFIAVIQPLMQKNLANLVLPVANSQSHHFNSHLYPYSQNGVIIRHEPDKNKMFYAFDTECIHEVDNFQIYIEIFTHQTECLNTTSGIQK